MGDIGGIVRTATGLYSQFKAAYDAGNDADAERHLSALKAQFIHFPTYLDPAGVASPTKVPEIMIVRDTLEHAVLLAARRGNLDDFEVYVQQLKLYYGYKGSAEAPLEESSRRLLITGMNLLRLLVASKTSEFHSELATIRHGDHSHMFIRLPLNLERYLMEGSYNRLLNARSQVPSTEFVPLMQMLEQTVRNEIAACLPTSYKVLSLTNARELLMLDNVEDVKAIGQGLKWPLDARGEAFVFDTAPIDTKAGGLGSDGPVSYKSVLAEHVQFAAQLQRVV